MSVPRSEIQKALDDLISNEEGMRFQGLAVVLAKRRWPDFIACERKKDLGADAIAKPEFAAEGEGKVLACSLTADLAKIKSDAEKVKKAFPGITKLIFATPAPVTNTTSEPWAAEIKAKYGYELAIMSREDIVTSLTDPANASLLQSQLGLRSPSVIYDQELIDNIRTASAEIVDSWRNRLKTGCLVEPRGRILDQKGRDTGETTTLQDLSLSLRRSERIVVEGAAGRGKTTALIQLAQLGRHALIIPLLVDLPALTRSGQDILTFIAGSRPFQARRLDAPALATASQAVQFVFLLNGWNEIGESEALRGDTVLRDVERNFPASGIAVATRTHHVVPPLPGATRVLLQPLTRRQRSIYITERLPEQSPILRRHIESDSTLDEITRTPLILSEVTSLFKAGAKIPRSKIGVIAAVIEMAETGDEHRTHLQHTPLHGLAREYLAELASELIGRGEVDVLESDARRLISCVTTRLKEDGQISAEPEPAAVLHSLSAHHFLERQDYPEVTYRFEHQQFQEYYAALDIRRQLFALSAGEDAEQKHAFLTRYINEPAWSEPLRMIADDIKRSVNDPMQRQESLAAGVLLVELALSVDPVFAGGLSRLCGPEVWEKVRATVGSRLRLLHGSKDDASRHCGLAAMLASGADDFKDIVLPLLASDNQQDRLGTYRTWEEFHTSTLGSDWQDQVRSWSEPARISFVSELLRRGNVTEVVPLAASDSSYEVLKATAERLGWIGADDELVTFIGSIDVATADALLCDMHSDLIPPTLHPRAIEALHAQLPTLLEPVERLRNLLKQAECGKLIDTEQLKTELGKMPEQSNEHQEYYVIKPALNILKTESPEWVSEWVAERIASRMLWRDDWLRLITTVSEGLKATLIARLETEDISKTRRGDILSVLAAAADDGLIERVWAKLFDLRRKRAADGTNRDSLAFAVERQLENLLRSASPNLVVGAIAELFSHDVDLVQVDAITRVFSNVARSAIELRTRLDEALREQFTCYLRAAVAPAIKDDSSGELKAHLASVISLVAGVDAVAGILTLIRADVEAQRTARTAREHGNRNIALMSYATWNLRSIATLDPSAAVSVCIDLLIEPDYERSVTDELVRLVPSVTVDEGVSRELQFDEIWRKRAERTTLSSADAVRAATALRDLALTLLRDRVSAPRTAPYDYRLHNCALALAAIDGKESADLVLEVIELATEYQHYAKIGALERLLFSGARLPADRVIPVVEAVFHRLRRHGLQQQEFWLLKRACRTLPFVDPPAEGLRRLSQLIREIPIYSHDLGDLVRAIGHSRAESALRCLKDLANDDRLQDFWTEWVNAVATLGTPEARKLLLSFVDRSKATDIPEVEFGRADVLTSRLADLAREDHEIEQQLFDACGSELQTNRRLLLARIMASIGSVRALVASLKLIADDATPPIPYEIHKALEDSFIERRPHGSQPHSYTLHPRSSEDIRRAVYDMSKDDRRRNSAYSLIAQIEEWRLEYGRPVGEARHPDVESGEPWPPLRQ